MENAPLNKAHHHGRQAESHLRHLRFDEAIESHQKAIAALNDTLQSTKNVKVMDSLRLQRDAHQKNIELVHLKKAQFEQYKRAVAEQRLKNHPLTLEQTLDEKRLDSICDIQISIFKTLDEQDSLLNSLNVKRNVSLNDDNEGTSDGIKVSIENANEVKETKSESTIIEDIVAANQQLHILIFNLVSQIDDSSSELERLRERVKSLEKQRKTSLHTSNKSSDSPSKADNSPTSSEKENRRESVIGEEQENVMPESSYNLDNYLPPLELPNFDYNF